MIIAADEIGLVVTGYAIVRGCDGGAILRKIVLRSVHDTKR